MTSNDTDFFTPTMAKIHASQGYLEEAVRIYTHIVERSPHREDLKEALQDLKNRIANLQEDGDDAADPEVGKTETSPVVESWVKILLRYGHILHLRNIQKELGEK